ncbi:MFS transporter [Streptomyces lomondensis]|uniref:MFS transporter n=1 Tax=Streptomyces lomondensis TaxID=68229 RepID=A0ABQ2X038_9ACTN|nr:MFS transporter [Streptomyces lomondensis]MCF0076134.1 MFS transporter [Streptomyces lomondensis]GGW88654.1 MFS transporter [Streptomyces lomondensis]
MNPTEVSEPGRKASGQFMKPLLPLALATFAVGTDAFVIAGLLPAIAADFDVSIAAAGQLVTAFALTFAVTAPVLGWLLSPLDRRTALQLALVVFTVGNAVTALSPNYELALFSRVLTAVGAATITATASSAAVAVTPEERRGRAMAFVIGGLTVSTALGMPFGNMIGHVDWRLTLWAVAALGVIAAIGTSVGLPKITLPATSLGARLAPLRQPRMIVTLLATLLVMGGHYMVYTYIGAVTADATAGTFTQALTLILLAWGIGAVVGNLLAGYLVDSLPTIRVAVAALAAATVLLAISPLAVNNLAVVIVWAAIWGVTDGAPSVIQQYRLVSFAPASAPVLFGLNSSAVFLGVALGGGLGGIAQDWLPVTSLGLPAAVLALVATTLTVVHGKRARTETSPEAAPAGR